MNRHALSKAYASTGEESTHGNNKHLYFMRIINYVAPLLMLMLLGAGLTEAKEITIGNFRYEIVQFWGSDEDEAIVVGLAEGFIPSGQLYFPTKIKFEGKDVKVTGLGWSDFTSHEGDTPVIGGYDGITSVRIPKHMRIMGRIEFKDCPHIEKYEVENGSENFTTVDGALVELTDMSGVRSRRLFRYPSAKTASTYVVPSEIGSISFGAFAANRHLKKLVLIGEQWLNYCWQYDNRSIETVDCTNSEYYRTDEYGAIFYFGRTFTGLCPGRVYKKYTVPETCSYLTDGAFCNAQVDEVVFPASVSGEAAEPYMFLESEVRKVTFQGEAPCRVWECAFMGCDRLESIELGASAEGSLDIQTCAFRDCVSLTTVKLSDATKEIGISARAFEECRSLKEFPLTSKMRIKTLAFREFAGCENLTSFRFGCVSEFDSRQGYSFAGSGLKEVHWPTGMKAVPRGCFADCRQLEKVYLKETTTDLYEDAFARSGLAGLNMMGVSWWSRSAFSGCQNLIRLYFPDNGSTVQYHTVDFISESPQIVVNNPKIEYLEEQEECPGIASLYISMVNGGVNIGNGWRSVYVPGSAYALYSNLTASDVREMYSYEIDPAKGTVRIVPLASGVKITSVVIEGEEAAYTSGNFSIGRPFGDGGTTDIRVNYTVFGNQMTSRYTDVYSGISGIDDVEISDQEQLFTISGIPVDRETASPGIYIRKTPTGTEKIIVTSPSGI